MPIIITNSFLPSAVMPVERYSVWLKREWGDTWQRVPYLMPETSLESAAPGDSEARLRWEYGRFVNLWYHTGGVLFPLQIDNWLVAIQAHSNYGVFVAWIGVVVGQTIRTEGTTPDALPVGYQDFEARGLEYLLERRRVLGTYVGDGESWVYLPRTYDFNVAQGRTQTSRGNMSAAVHPDAGCRMFEEAEGSERWNNYEIARYLLACFQPWYPAGEVPGGAVELVPLFYLTGQVDALRYLYGEYRFHGRSVREALHELIDRRRGFGWHIMTDGIGAIYIRVYSIAEQPIVGRTAYIPANPSQGWVPIGWDHVVGVEYNISSMRQVDRIVVESDEPIRVMATLGMDNGSLEPGWDALLEEEYLEATDEERGTDKYAAVYSRLQIPKDYPWTDWAPYVGPWGDVDVSGYGSWWHHGKAFLRWLPLEEEGVAEGERQYKEPFVLVAKKNRTLDLAYMLHRNGVPPMNLAAAQAATKPPITEAEFDDISADDTVITVADLAAVFAAESLEWLQLDRLTAEEDLPSCSQQLADVGLAFYLRSRINHVFAHNHWDGESEIEAQFDYALSLATLQWNTDMALRVTIPVFSARYVDSSGQVVYESNPQGREIHVVVPGAECWVVGTDTVVGVEDGALVLWNEGAPGILRNDWEDVWWVAVASYVWYGSQRGAASITIERQAPWFRIGDLIRGTVNGRWHERLGTTVTSIQRNYREGLQIVRTGYGELDPERLVEPRKAAG